MWGIVTLSLATYCYCSYNVTVYLDWAEYETNSLYIYGDCWYLVNAFIYVLCSMRDSECFWFMPSYGVPAAVLDRARLWSGIEIKLDHDISYR